MSNFMNINKKIEDNVVKKYKKIENITLGCYAVGLWLACVTKFLPFILLTVMAYPISFRVVDNKWSGRKCHS